MKRTLEVLNELESDGIFSRYAIGGAMAAILNRVGRNEWGRIYIFYICAAREIKMGKMGSRLNSESIETRSLPTLTHCFPRNLTFYVAHPIRSIREQETSRARIFRPPRGQPPVPFGDRV
jgi:hypothetical protein